MVIGSSVADTFACGVKGAQKINWKGCLKPACRILHCCFSAHYYGESGVRLGAAAGSRSAEDDVTMGNHGHLGKVSAKDDSRCNEVDACNVSEECSDFIGDNHVSS